MRVAAAHVIGAIAGCFKHSSVMELCNLAEAKMKEVWINFFAEDVVLCPKSQPKISASTLFQSLDVVMFQGYELTITRLQLPSLGESLKDTPTHEFASVWFEWRKTMFYPTHYSELICLAALYKVLFDEDLAVNLGNSFRMCLEWMLKSITYNGTEWNVHT
ncbi:hypothetical protein Tco_1429994 [Tanacetum coccineum]